MPQPTNYWRQDKFTGGMVSRDTPTRLQRHECERLVNFDLDHAEYATKRNGISRMNSTALAGGVQGLHAFYAADGTLYFLVMAGGTLYRWNTATSVFDTLATGYAASIGNKARFIEFDNLVIIVNGADAPQKYDINTGTVGVLGGSPPVASFGAFYYNHLFLNDVSAPTTIYYSETFDPESGYGSTNYLAKMEVGDQSPVTAFHAMDQELIVGKRRSITAIRGMDPRDFNTVHNRAAYTNEQGVLNQECILDVGGVPWFLNENGVFSLGGPFITPEQSWAIHNYISGLDPVRIERSFGVQVQLKRQVKFFVPYGNGTHMDLGLVGHAGQGRQERAAWTLWEGPELTAATVLYSDTEGEVVYYGDADGYVYKTGTDYQDHTTPVTSVYVSDYRPGVHPEELSMLRTVSIEAETGEQTSVFVDYHADRRRLEDSAAVVLAAPAYESTADPDDPLGARQLRRATAFSNHSGLRHQVEITHAENKPFRLAAVETEARSLGRRRGRDR